MQPGDVRKESKREKEGEEREKRKLIVIDFEGGRVVDNVLEFFIKWKQGLRGTVVAFSSSVPFRFTRTRHLFWLGEEKERKKEAKKKKKKKNTMESRGNLL